MTEDDCIDSPLEEDDCRRERRRERRERIKEMREAKRDLEAYKIYLLQQIADELGVDYEAPPWKEDS